MSEIKCTFFLLLSHSLIQLFRSSNLTFFVYDFTYPISDRYKYFNRKSNFSTNLQNHRVSIQQKYSMINSKYVKLIYFFLIVDQIRLGWVVKETIKKDKINVFL